VHLKDHKKKITKLKTQQEEKEKQEREEREKKEGEDTENGNHVAPAPQCTEHVELTEEQKITKIVEQQEELERYKGARLEEELRRAREAIETYKKLTFNCMYVSLHLERTNENSENTTDSPGNSDSPPTTPDSLFSPTTRSRGSSRRGREGQVGLYQSLEEDRVDPHQWPSRIEAHLKGQKK
jgi:hypothetical protein